MGQHVILGSTDITVTDHDFSTGYQDGYARFLERYHGKPLTDLEVYGFLVRNTLDVLTTDRYRAGYVVGWCAALHSLGRPGATVGYCAETKTVQVQA
jgi:hypothetical protein